MTVIDAVSDFVSEREVTGEAFRFATLRRYVNRQGLIVPNQTISRALRQLRLEGSASYEYDSTKGLYKVYPYTPF